MGFFSYRQQRRNALEKYFCSHWVQYNLLFPGLLPEGSAVGFVGNESDPDMENFFLVVVDAV
jgi:hypothetical protein